MQDLSVPPWFSNTERKSYFNPLTILTETSRGRALQTRWPTAVTQTWPVLIAPFHAQE